MEEKIDKTNVQEIVELNMVQKGMLFHYLKETGTNLYNVQLALNIMGDLDKDALEQALHMVQSKNEVLRSVFRWEQISKPLQIILHESPASLHYHDLSAKGSKEASELIEAFAVEDQLHRFDLGRLPLRVTLIRTADRSFILYITHHHILYDGWSTAILIRELFYYYRQLKGDGIKTGPALKPAYKEIIQALREKAATTDAKAYWKQYLSQYEIVSFSAGSHCRPGHEDRIDKTCFTVSKAPLDRFTSEQRITKASVIYAAFGILLQRHLNVSDVVFGTTVSDRDVQVRGIGNVIGNFINTIPLRVTAPENSPLREVVTAVSKDLLQRNVFSSTSYHEIKEMLSLKPAENLFDALVVIENYPLDGALPRDEDHLSVSLRSVYENTSIPLVCTVFFNEDDVRVELSYKTGLLHSAYAESLIHHLKVILDAILSHDGTYIGSLRLLSEVERQRLLKAYNDTEVRHPDYNTVIDLFEEQVEKTPGHIALRSSNTTMRYREVYDVTSKITCYLRESAGVKTGDLVGLMLERETYLIPFIFGILKAGAAYIPIDPHYPEERVSAIIEDSKAKILITRGKHLNSLKPPHHCTLIDLDAVLDQVLASQPCESGNVAKASDLAYVIYTSGSTGKPKGVMITHGSVVNIIQCLQRRYPLKSTDSYLLKTNYTFDVSVAEIFGWFAEGGSLSALMPGAEGDPGRIMDAIERDKITHINFVPSMFSAFVEELGLRGIEKIRSLKYIFIAGEALTTGLVKKFNALGTGIRLENIYGPTEGTVYSCSYSVKDIDHMQRVPIGKPLDNIRLYILNGAHELQPTGVQGELCIGGAGLARGYLNNEQLTQQKFIYSAAAGERVYRTGDLASWMQDGNIEFWGRMDNQVKIRGFRIELGEVEGQLLRHEQIREAAVLAVEKDNLKDLTAYYVSESPLGATALRAFLLRSLPEYMVPAYFIHMQSMPLTTSGKLDRRALPQPIAANNPRHTIATPRGETEERLWKIWSDVLGHKNINDDSNFFDIGGDSLKLIAVRGKIRSVFNREVQITDLLDLPTIASLALFLGGPATPAHTGATQPTDAPSAEGNGNIQGSSSSDIAIIGMACRFPGAVNTDAFWKNLQTSKESVIRKEDDGRIRSLIRAKGFLEDHDLFDAEFFNYSHADAEIMDPQIRIFHECTWQALEDAGYNPLSFQGAIGLYAGASPNPYYNMSVDKSYDDDFLEKWTGLTYSDKDFLCARVSYKLNLTGPSISISTACSTSLVAVNTACDDLLSGKCDMAVAGGVSVTLHDEEGYVHHKGMIMSPDGRCRAFDAAAEGTVGGNGAGVVVLKKLDAAVRDGDVVHAVIKGTAVNNDGYHKIGFTAPSIEGQSKVIGMAIRNACIAAESISYVEAHGSGTPLGDPIEISALTKAFNTDKKKFCAIGSVKTNIGHLDAAAGIAGLIKTVLSLKNRQLPPSLHFSTANPNIDFESGPFYVNTQLKDWEVSHYPLRAGVSSFGIGGTNAHIILEEAPRPAPSSDSRKFQLLMLSAKTPSALDNNITQLIGHLKRDNHCSLADSAYTLQVGRSHSTFREMVVCKDRSEAIEILSARRLSAKKRLSLSQGHKPLVVFMFSGQGSQYRICASTCIRMKPCSGRKPTGVLLSLIKYPARTSSP